MRIVEHYQGCFRVYADGCDWFGQVKKNGRQWFAEIRKASDCDLIQYAGIWRTKKDAIEEVESIVARRNR